MDLIKFTGAAVDAGKAGILTPDEHGYYEVMVGALNSYNHAGEYYTAQGAIDLFSKSSLFMRRIERGALYSELGHPKRLPGMSVEAFYNRVVTIEETNVCAHFSDIYLDVNYGKKNPQLNNPELIAIIAKVKPAGPKAQALELAINNPKQNMAFSIRGLTDNKYENGRTNRTLTNIITFDFVIEPGIKTADKRYSPSLESFSLQEMDNTTVDISVLKRVLTERVEDVAFESNREVYQDILSSLSKPKASRLRNW